MDDDLLSSWAKSAEHVYAADSGADRLIALGFSPVVVGDFDSFASLPRASRLRLVQSIDQATTDCDKLLALVEKDGHESVTLTGTEGDLPDHVLATFSSVVACSLRVRIAFRRGVGHVVRPSHPAQIAAKRGQRVSLIPLARCAGARLAGTAWPLEGAEIEPGGLMSVSNEAVGGEVSASLESGCALLFVETREIGW